MTVRSTHFAGSYLEHHYKIQHAEAVKAAKAAKATTTQTSKTSLEQYITIPDNLPWKQVDYRLGDEMFLVGRSDREGSLCNRRPVPSRPLLDSKSLPSPRP